MDFTEMTLQELITWRYYNGQEDEDYEYELWKERQEQQEEQERLAWEEMLADRF